jgi:hypothetical protein
MYCTRPSTKYSVSTLKRSRRSQGGEHGAWSMELEQEHGAWGRSSLVRRGQGAWGSDWPPRPSIRAGGGFVLVGSRPLENLRTGTAGLAGACHIALLHAGCGAGCTSPVWPRGESAVKPRATPTNHAAGRLSSNDLRFARLPPAHHDHPPPAPRSVLPPGSGYGAPGQGLRR